MLHGPEGSAVVSLNSLRQHCHAKECNMLMDGFTGEVLLVGMLANSGANSGECHCHCYAKRAERETCCKTIQLFP